jgi:hypothetical protein
MAKVPRSGMRPGNRKYLDRGPAAAIWSAVALQKLICDCPEGCSDTNGWWKNAANGAIITVVFSRGDPQNDSKREVGVFSRDGVVRAMAETG